MPALRLQPQRRTVQRLAKRLHAAGIDYALIGSMALEAHGLLPRADNVALLLRPEGVDEFRRRFVPRSYQEVVGRRHTYTERRSQVVVRFAVSGMIPGAWPDGQVPFPDPAEVSLNIDNVNVADCTSLIAINLAARRPQYLADTVELIRLKRLDESFAEQLHPSLRPDFLRCLEAVRREDEFNARDD